MVSATRKETMGSSKLNALDFDTEDIEPDYEPSESDIAEDANAGREHYVEMRLLAFSLGSTKPIAKAV